MRLHYSFVVVGRECNRDKIIILKIHHLQLLTDVAAHVESAIECIVVKPPVN